MQFQLSLESDESVSIEDLVDDFVTFYTAGICVQQHHVSVHAQLVIHFPTLINLL